MGEEFQKEGERETRTHSFLPSLFILPLSSPLSSYGHAQPGGKIILTAKRPLLFFLSGGE